MKLKVLVTLFVLFTPAFLFSGAGSFAAVGIPMMMSGNRHSKSYSQIARETEAIIKHRTKILDAAARVAKSIPNAAQVKVLGSLVSFGECAFPPYHVIKVVDKKDNNLAFMLWGLDTTAGNRVWRLIIYEKNLDDFNHYVRSTPFWDAVIEDPNIMFIRYC